MNLKCAQIQPGQTGHEAGRKLLEKMYRELTGEALPPIAVTERGKPYFTEGSLYFSISPYSQQFSSGFQKRNRIPITPYTVRHLPVSLCITWS